MAPVLSGKVIENEQFVLAFSQTLARFWILGVVFFQEVSEYNFSVRFRLYLPDFVDTINLDDYLETLGFSKGFIRLACAL